MASACFQIIKRVFGIQPHYNGDVVPGTSAKSFLDNRAGNEFFQSRRLRRL
jgi:hypothetical protein